jgi:hypothetical protein
MPGVGGPVSVLIPAVHELLTPVDPHADTS